MNNKEELTYDYVINYLTQSINSIDHNDINVFRSEQKVLLHVPNFSIFSFIFMLELFITDSEYPVMVIHLNKHTTGYNYIIMDVYDKDNTCHKHNDFITQIEEILKVSLMDFYL